MGVCQYLFKKFARYLFTVVHFVTSLILMPHCGHKDARRISPHL
ncbi:hypothetical protein CUS_6045 [Ruminococcus albus 8]|uniref:Uncharacterized protein n=1 Tax=Ruminococcus albus 8 TaxID=246199 RepID=E9SD33_RUMAL|nr:hypothetical protein CUS_6045 [Ruminococcus albus 8]